MTQYLIPEDFNYEEYCECNGIGSSDVGSDLEFIENKSDDDDALGLYSIEEWELENLDGCDKITKVQNNSIDKYENYFEDCEWDLYIKDEEECFENNPIYYGEQNKQDLKKEFDRVPMKDGPLSKVELVSYLKNMDEIGRNIKRLSDAYSENGHLDMGKLNELVLNATYVLPITNEFFLTQSWNNYVCYFHREPNISSLIKYWQYLDLPTLIHQFEAITNRPYEIVMEPNGFTRSNFLLCIEPTLNVNKREFEKWIKEHGLEEKFKMGYNENQLKLNCSAICFNNEDEATRALELLNGKPLPLDVGLAVCTILNDPNNQHERKPWYSRKERLIPTEDLIQPDICKGYDYEVLQLESKLKDPNVPIYFIDFECAVIYNGPYGALPVELSILKTTISSSNDQITEHDVFHSFIHPGSIPPSIKEQCYYNSLQITGIPFRNFRLFRKDYSNLCEEISDFMKQDGIVIAKGKETEEKALKLLELMGNRPLNIHVYEYSSLLGALSKLNNEHLLEDQANQMLNECKKYAHHEYRCKYHYDNLSQPKAKKWHCSSLDILSYKDALTHFYNTKYHMIWPDTQPVTEPETINDSEIDNKTQPDVSDSDYY